MRRATVLPLVLAVASIAPVGCRSEPMLTGSAGPRLVVLYAPCTVNKSFLSPYDASI